ncbi:MAG TPA: hypothetical protein VGM23_03385, partial [Armatimonadota bacterium]
SSRAFAGVLLVLLLSIPLLAAEGLGVRGSLPRLGTAAMTSFSPVTLRGYGTVEGACWRFPAQSASILRIRCQDTDKAKLTLAKYLSDLAVLPGVKRATSGNFPFQTVNGQGAVSAVRFGQDVYVLAAANEADLAALYTDGLTGDKRNAVFTAEVAVPMWLDRWDKYGFRFYYRPWELPKGKKWEEYDIPAEFDYADRRNKAGFLFWDAPFPLDYAERMMNNTWWNWGLNEAERRKLPVSIQLSYSNDTMLANRYREETTWKMPQYCGDRYGPASDFDGGQGAISWNSERARLLKFREMQDEVRKLNGYQCITSWLEPHSELQHSPVDIMMEYGPVADQGFRTFLREKYNDVQTVSQRWTGRPDALKSWDDVRVPEVASFLGWGPEALDLSGPWQVNYPESKEKITETFTPPAEWLTPGCDDTAWATVTAPGNDRTMFLPKKPAVYRRAITVPAAWRKQNQRVWLYVWDLNRSYKWPVKAVLNGADLGDNRIQFNTPHWGAYEATAALKDGANLLALYLPEGYLAYRVYLSPHPPVQYPDLGPQMNARWVDFIDWTIWSRVRSVGQSMAAIRQVDPNRNFELAAPDFCAADIRQLAVKYGGEFHNTGYMGAFWADILPMLMRGANLPFSLEPGSPADTLDGFKNMMGLYATEGIQGIDYFIHIGNILWPDDIRAYFEAHQNEISLTGKYHAPQAEIAFLHSTRMNFLTGYPWGKDFNTNLGSGYWSFTAANDFKNEYDRDAVTEVDFRNGNAAKYHMIIDQNTSVLDDSTVQGIERYVRDGGVFVTFVQTGRHTPEARDAWPIAKLTGYEVTGIDRHKADGTVERTRKISLAPGQTIFRPENWTSTAMANGLSLRKVAPECQDLLVWDDGSIAAGLRPLGKGFVVHLGVKFVNDRYWYGNPDQTKRMVR